MTQAENRTEKNTRSSPNFEADVLFFLNRTLQFHSADPEAGNVFEKLQNLKNALDKQEKTLLSWPDSPSKVRIHESLAKAKSLVARLVDDFGSTMNDNSAPGIGRMISESKYLRDHKR
jgi:hypothetical protein